MTLEISLDNFSLLKKCVQSRASTAVVHEAIQQEMRSAIRAHKESAINEVEDFFARFVVTIDQRNDAPEIVNIRITTPDLPTSP